MMQGPVRCTRPFFFAAAFLRACCHDDDFRRCESFTCRGPR